jgi:lysophospholipase L1-like esterase
MRILFQGDSITDCGRSRTDFTDIGRGYAHLVKARLSLDYPGKFEFQNRGVGGNRVSDVYARMYPDIINLNPDLMSIMIGTNDYPWFEDEKYLIRYERVFNMLLEDVKTDLPNVKFMILEPFLLPGDRVVAENYPLRLAQTEKRSEAAQRIAEKFDAKFVPIQKHLDAVLDKAPIEYWTLEGVHLTEASNQILADQWIKAFKEMYSL